jgi:MFS superfamily sulfate permease-like transporter
MNKNKLSIPSDGMEGLKRHYKDDATSGFVVFLLALPLSLGIAKASDFPPIMGLVTAIIGGIFVTFIMGSRLTIKGPAAGLIVIVAGAVADFGGGLSGWRLALGAVLVAGLLQILFGLFKWGKLVDFFPLSAIHGMLAAIGLIIIGKQIPVLLNVHPSLYKGLSPIELFTSIPQFVLHLDPRATLIGAVSLMIMLGWPLLKHQYLKHIPAPLMVLLIAIPAELIMQFQTTEPDYALVHIGNLLESIRVNVDFGGMAQPLIFLKYVIMFALVGSLESLLTVKAIDLLDPFKRKSDANKDLIAVGAGNVFSALLGGLPMIAEVARSSANVSQGAKTRWANFFHGFFLLVFVIAGSHLIELIPNTALAAMLITVGIKLAHPREMVHMFHIGRAQLAIFLTTIFFTLYEDLLVGIAVGMLLKIMIHVLNGTPVSSIFKAPTVVSFVNGIYLVEIDKAAVFTNLLGIKNKLNAIPTGSMVTIDLKKTKLVDHSVMESLNHFKSDYERSGGTVEIIGLEDHEPVSKHSTAARKKRSVTLHKEMP